MRARRTLDVSAPRGARVAPIYLAIGVLMCVSLAGFAVAGCASPPDRTELGPRWRDTGTPKSAVYGTANTPTTLTPVPPPTPDTTAV